MSPFYRQLSLQILFRLFLQIAIELRVWVALHSHSFRVLFSNRDWTWDSFPSLSLCRARIILHNEVKLDLHGVGPLWAGPTTTFRYIDDKMYCKKFRHIDENTQWDSGANRTNDTWSSIKLDSLTFQIVWELGFEAEHLSSWPQIYFQLKTLALSSPVFTSVKH